jgi:predicted DNA-binding transcriptional regulator AlpA
MNRHDELLTVGEVLALLGGVPLRTFYRWRELGIAPKAVRLPNRELRFWRSEVLAWLDAHREGAA